MDPRERGVQPPPTTTRDRVRQVAAAIGPVAVAIVLVEIVASALIAAHVANQDWLESAVRDAGAWAPLAFVVLMALLVPVNVPGIVFVVPSTALFGTVNGILLSLVGGFIASSIGILVARRAGRPVFERRLPDWLRSWESQLAQRAFWTIVVLRSVTFLLQPVDWICGLSSIPTRKLLTATFVGLIVPTVVIALTGGGLTDLLV
jgi:uncharacterized membrane protein YdjX (TVP38/TMEM64 family)